MPRSTASTCIIRKSQACSVVTAGGAYQVQIKFCPAMHLAFTLGPRQYTAYSCGRESLVLWAPLNLDIHDAHKSKAFVERQKCSDFGCLDNMHLVVSSSLRELMFSNYAHCKRKYCFLQSIHLSQHEYRCLHEDAAGQQAWIWLRNKHPRRYYQIGPTNLIPTVDDIN